MSDAVTIGAAGPHDGLVPALTDLLVDCVEGGASISFMLPLERSRVEAFWAEVLDDAASGRRVVLVARERMSGSVVGSVQVILAAPENQPHRGEIAKLIVHPRARRQGIAEALMGAAERAAIDAGKSLLVLDTASEVAERLYARRGWKRVAVVPGYALLPTGEPVDTTIFFKVLTPEEVMPSSSAGG